MKLADWLTETGTPDNVLATQLGVSRVTLFRYKHGYRVPDRKTMAKISEATDGKVEPNDFFAVEAPEQQGAA